jgi:ABC-type Fe3+ transport system substrate-binding protein
MSQNMVGGLYTSAIGFGWNTELLKKKLPEPKCWSDMFKPACKGEVAIGISFIFGLEAWRHNKYPVATAAPCEGTSYEIGGIALVKGSRTFKPDPRIPSMDSVRLIRYDFEKYGSSAERRRLLDRWQGAVESLRR